jgi:tetratricopeptide (TPR) repeat protein
VIYVTPALAEAAPVRFHKIIENLKIILAIAISMVMFVPIIPSSAFNAYAQQTATCIGGSANSGAATGGAAICKPIICSGICEFFEGSARGKQSNGDSELLLDTIKGGELLVQGSYSEATRYFDKALDIDPNHVIALAGKGYALDALGNHAEDMSYIDRALAIDPNDGIALDFKGIVIAKSGNTAEAIRYFDKALSIDPNDGIAVHGKQHALDIMDRQVSPTPQ